MVSFQRNEKTGKLWIDYRREIVYILSHIFAVIFDTKEYTRQSMWIVSSAICKNGKIYTGKRH